MGIEKKEDPWAMLGQKFFGIHCVSELLLTSEC